MKKRIDRINNFRYPISQPTVFDEEELTVLKLVSKVAYKINETVGEVNNWIDYMDIFVESFDKKLQPTVAETLTKWQDSGMLDVIINDALQSTVTETLTEWQDSGVLDVIINDSLQTQMDVLEDETQRKLGLFESHLVDFMAKFPDNLGSHNSIFRGKYLGSSVTETQYTAISSGTFTDLYIGDYWTISGVNWRIASFNYYYNTGDNPLTSNHVTIVPDTQLYTHVMNDTNITTDGYTGSKMYTVGLEQAKSTIRGIFGTHLVKHRQIYSNASVDGKASGWTWVDSEVDLMNEIMLYGSVVCGESTDGGSGYNIGVGKSQLPLFALNPRMINTRQTYWLRDVVSVSDFARVSNLGNASTSGSSYSHGVRPVFSIS